MKKTLYLVKMAVWGADKPEKIYFETKSEAMDFYSSHNYCDRPAAVSVRADRVKDLI